MSARSEYVVKFRVIDYCRMSVWAETAEEAKKLALEDSGYGDGIERTEAEVVGVIPAGVQAEEETTCPQCGGRGTESRPWDDAPEECPGCKGTGSVQADNKDSA